MSNFFILRSVSLTNLKFNAPLDTLICHTEINTTGCSFEYSVMQSDEKSFCEDVVLEGVNIA